MVAILGYGSYLPLYRINRQTIAEQHGETAGDGEIAVPAHDEGLVPFAVHAAKNALSHAAIDGWDLDAVFTASISDPFNERGVAPHVAYAVGATESTRTGDFQGAATAATSAVQAAADAIEAGQAERILVVGSDILDADEESDVEQRSGAGAAAVILAEDSDVAKLQGSANCTSDFVGRFSHTDRGVQEGNSRLNRSRYIEAVTTAVNQVSQTEWDYVALPAPDGRWGAKLLDSLETDATLRSTFDEIGYAGAAGVLVELVNAFEHAGAEETVLLASYGPGGSDVLVFTTGDADTPPMTTRDYRDSKEYVTYAKHREYRKRARGKS